MKHSRVLNWVSLTIMLMFSVSLSYSLYCLYRSLTGVSVRGRTDVQTAALLSTVRERLKLAKSQKDAELSLKILEGNGAGAIPQNRLQDLRRIYGLDGDAKNRERTATNLTFDVADVQKAKVETVNQLFNFYRQQVVKRNLAIASLISGVIAEGHSVLMREPSADLYMSYIRKAKEQIDSARSMAATLPDSGQVIERINQVDTSLNDFTRAAKQLAVFEKSRDELFKQADVAISGTLQEISGRLDRTIDNLQRDFLISIFLFLCSILGSLLLTSMGSRRISAWFQERSQVLGKILKSFGREEATIERSADEEFLKSDPAWSELLEDIKRAEQGFLVRSAAETAMTKCFGGAFIVFSPERMALNWNSHAVKLLNISSRSESDGAPMEELFARAGFSRRREGLGDFLRKIDATNEYQFQLEQRLNGAVVPVEVSVFPIRSGQLKGGFACVFREMKDEEKRVAERIFENLKVMDQIVEGILQKTNVTVDTTAVPEQVLPIVEKLRTLKVSLDERELLWRAEIEAITAQVKREEEYLTELTAELAHLKGQQDRAQGLSVSLEGSWRKLSELAASVTQQLGASIGYWQRISHDLESKSAAALNAKTYEDKVRGVVSEMRVWGEDFRSSLTALRKCRDWARVHAINLNVGGATDIEVFQERARRYALVLNEFYERIGTIEKELTGFIDKHPGASALASLEVGVDLAPLTRDLQAAQEGMRKDLSTWEKLSQELKIVVSGSTEFAKDFENRSKELTILRENISRVNESAIKELERWS